MEHSSGKHQGHTMQDKPYLRLLAMAVFSFAAMYVLMYAMVNRLGNVVASLNQFYMAGLMAAPMVIIELLIMSRMYPSRKANLIIGAVSIILLSFFMLSIREQAAIRDEEFLRSMIPHHAGAILMAEESTLSDPETRALAQHIIESQQAEIEEMKAILARLEK